MPCRGKEAEPNRKRSHRSITVSSVANGCICSLKSIPNIEVSRMITDGEVVEAAVRDQPMCTTFLKPSLKWDSVGIVALMLRRVQWKVAKRRGKMRV